MTIFRSEQRDLFRHSPQALARAHRAAADAARMNPYESPERAEKRAQHHEAAAAELEGNQ